MLPVYQDTRYSYTKIHVIHEETLKKIHIDFLESLRKKEKDSKST